MFKKTAVTMLAFMGAISYLPAFADDSYTTCSIEVAVATPPVKLDERVVFNISSERGTNRSITLKGGSEPTVFSNLICSGVPYVVSATLYASPVHPVLSNAVGQCVLKAGEIVMNEAYNSVSVVFPNDFNCG